MALNLNDAAGAAAKKDTCHMEIFVGGEESVIRDVPKGTTYATLLREAGLSFENQSIRMNNVDVQPNDEITAGGNITLVPAVAGA